MKNYEKSTDMMNELIISSDRTDDVIEWTKRKPGSSVDSLVRHVLTDDWPVTLLNSVRKARIKDHPVCSEI